MLHIRSLALITGLLPIVAAHISYLIAALHGHVPWCNPYWAGCTSISATGRESPEFYFFKATMIPTAVIVVIFWQVAHRWLLVLGDPRNWQTRAIPTIGLIAALCLIMYTTALGAGGDLFRVQRRVGVVIYFTFTYFAQLLLTRRIALLNRAAPTVPASHYRWLFGLVSSVWIIGLFSIVLGFTYADYEEIEDAFEWILAVLIHLYFVAIWFAWRATGFAIHFTAERGAR